MGDILRALGLATTPEKWAMTPPPLASDDPRTGGITGQLPHDPLFGLMRHVGGEVTRGDEPLNQPGHSDSTDITITGDKPFHGRKPSLLAILGDAMLAHGGYKPQFSQNRRDEDYRRAMEDYATDPIQAIKRLSQLKGHEKEAAKLYDAYTDNQRLQGGLDRQNRVFDLKLEDVVRDRVAGMMGSITPGDTEAYKKMRARALSYAEAKNVDMSADLPEEATTLDLEALRYGQIDPYKQERLKQFNTQEQGRNSRFYTGEGGKNVRAATAQAGTESRFQRGQSATQSRFERLHPPLKKFMTPKGPAELSPDGKHFRLMSDGSIWELQGGGKAKRVK